jgi:hypothetical protein
VVLSRSFPGRRFAERPSAFPLQDLKTGRAMNPTRMAGVSSQTGGAPSITICMSAYSERRRVLDYLAKGKVSCRLL